MGSTPLVTGQVPQNQGTGGTSSDLVSQLLGRKASIDSEIMNTLPHALAPQKQQGTPSPHLPGSFEFGVGQLNMPPAEGKHNAKAQGIAKTIAGVANIVGQIKKAEDTKQHREFAGKIEKVLAAQDAVSQAKTVQQGDPGFKDAQDVIKKNSQIINDTISADPKTKKKFEKAFDINFVDPSKNDQPEHKALESASKSYAEQLAAKTPDKLGPNVQAQAKLQQLSAIGASNDATIKAVLPLATQEMRDTNAMNRTIATQTGANQRADLKEQGENTRKQAELKKDYDQIGEHWNATKLESNTRWGVAGLQARSAMDRTMAQIDSRQKIADKIHGTDPERAAKLDTANAKNMTTLQNQLANTMNQTVQMRKSAADGQKDSYDKVIQGLERQQRYAAKWLQNYQERTDVKGKGLEEKGGSSGNSSTPSNTKTTVASNAKVIDPDPDDTPDDDDTKPIDVDDPRYNQ